MNRLTLRLGAAILVGVLVVMLTAGFAEASTVYTVQNGDSLFLVAKRYGTTAGAIKSANGLSSDWIYPGQRLTVPGGSGSGTRYTVATGDTLFLIARRFGTSVDALKNANKLWSNSIYPGQVLYIPVAIAREAVTVSRGFSRSDLDLLARVVYAEARGEVYQGQVAVAAVVLNRMKDPAYPKTIPEIIYQPQAFSCVNDGQINLQPQSSAVKAANEALSGVDPSHGALFFFNPAKTSNRYIWSRPQIITIGNHIFAR